jgi:chromosome partitioning protein
MIIATTNQKGGVGKTTTVINLGACIAAEGKQICVIDLDPQSNLTSGLGYTLNNIDQEQLNKGSIYHVLIGKKTIHEVTFQTRLNNLSLIPAGIELAGSEIELVNTVSRETILKDALKEIMHKYDYILIDCPPSLGLLTINALTASNEVLIPVQTEYFALEGLGQLLNTIKLIKSKLNQGLAIGGVVMTMQDARTNLSKQVVSEIQKVFGEKVYNTIIPRNVRLSEAPSHGKAILEYDPISAGALAYKSLAKEFLIRHSK